MIERKPDEFCQRRYDLIVVGGGIQGVMVALMAAKRRLRTLLLEREDFGSGTSFNSLRIVHGGLRYLQSLDLRRFRQSVRERRWFLTVFPELVKPMPCLMPLYGRGMRRRSILRTALTVNDLLSWRRNAGVAADNRIPPGRILSRHETIREFPGVQVDGLQGAAKWFDAAMPDSQRVLIETLRWAVAYGVDSVNYASVVDVRTQGRKVAGVNAVDEITKTGYAFRAPVVINACGPWAMPFASANDENVERFFYPSLAWNVLTSRPAPSRSALAITPQRPGAPTYFLHPWKGRLLIGTGHASQATGNDSAVPSEAAIQGMLDDMNACVPGLQLGMADVGRVFAGLLPATAPESAEISTRPVLYDHATAGGPQGFVSLCGVKFTTSRQLAERALNAIFGRPAGDGDGECPRPPAAERWSFATAADSKQESAIAGLKQLVADESVMRLQDIVFRRTDLWENKELTMALAPRIGRLLGWSESKSASETAELERDMAAGTPGAANSGATAIPASIAGAMEE